VLSALAAIRTAQNSARESLYRLGVFNAASLPAPVISIGNLTAASGKTPFVEYLARHYLDHHGLPSLILQLGGGTVDESVMLRHAFDGTPIRVCDSKSAHEARQILLDDPSLRLVLLDDGLQHLPLLRDYDIITINALAPFGNGHLHPRGTLREPVRPALRRADAAVLHHVDIAGQDRLAASRGKLDGLVPRHALRMQTQMTPVTLRSAAPRDLTLDMSDFPGRGEDVGLSKLDGAAVVCLTGVGSPAVSRSFLRNFERAKVVCAPWIVSRIGLSMGHSENFFPFACIVVGVTTYVANGLCLLCLG
jgi:tetraacyldisaccharide-1-P 4'-kinase